MFNWIKRFFTDEAFFTEWLTGARVWIRRALLTLKVLLLAVPAGMANGSIVWPEWMPSWVLMAMVGLSAVIQFGEKNLLPAEVKLLAKEAQGQPLAQVQAEVIAAKSPMAANIPDPPASHPLNRPPGGAT